MKNVIDGLVLFAGIYSCLYLLAAVIIAAGELRFRRQKPLSHLPRVSVVVCARNEENTIRQCLESLAKLDYPHEKLEIILVDDESEDTTPAVLEEFADRYTFFRVLSADGESHDLPGKQRPLNLGIRESSGEFVLVTDADCAVNPGWIRGHIAAYHDNIGIVGGITGISTDSGSLFSRLQNCDQVSKLAIAMGCAGLGFPLAIMGNNMSFKRDAYDACGGLEEIGPSIVEDVDLMYAVVGNTEYYPGWVRDEKGMVVSAPLENFRLLIEQRRRMLKVRSGIPLIGKTLLGIEIVMLFLFGITLIFVFRNPLPFAVIFLAWLLGIFIVFLPVPGKSLRNLLLIPGMFFFQALYGIAVSWQSVFGESKIVWKERIY